VFDRQLRQMSEVTYYVALPFVAADDGIAPGEAVECFNPNAAVMKAEALSRKPGNVGAIAFSRTGVERRLQRRQADPEIRRRAGRSERAVKLHWIRNEITRQRVQIRAQEREIRMLQRAGVSTASAELLLTRMRAKVDDLCREREALRAPRSAPDQ
jgi:hypothetical protein